MNRVIYSGRPTVITVEASWETCRDMDLDTFAGEQYDTIPSAISVMDDGSNIVIETVRTIEAWKRGEENAGRGKWTFPKQDLKRVLIAGKTVWGPRETVIWHPASRN
jgi:hypothetical protein